MKPIDHDFVALHEAHQRGDVETIRRLLEERPDLESNEHQAWIQQAAHAGHIAVVDFWLDRGWSVNHDGSLLYFAKDAAMARHLISRGAAVNAWNRIGGTPLHTAVVVAPEPSQKGRHRDPGADMEQIRLLLEAGADPSVANHEGLTPLGLAIKYKRKAAEQFLRAAGAPEKGKRPARERKKKAPKIDLRKDRDQILRYIVRRVRQFNPKKTSDLGPANSPVRQIELGFECTQAGWVALVFDTRPNAGPDGEWSALVDDVALKRTHWHNASDHFAQSATVDVVGLDGKTRKIKDARWVKVIGDLLKTVLLDARDQGVFKKLPTAERCHLGIEELTEEYGWPNHEDRGKRDLV